MLAALAALACAPQVQEPLRLDLAADSARQVVVDRQAGQYLGHVSTVLLADGHTILAAYPLGHGAGPIVCKRSGDGGRTWSERLPVPANWATSRETPTLWRTVDGDGTARLLLWSGLYPARLAIGRADGTDFGELAPAGDWGGIVVMGDVVATAQRGHYLAFWHDDGRFLRAQGAGGGRATGTFTLLQAESLDGGRTWSQPHAIWSGSDLQLCEPGAVRSDDGRELALLLRENSRRAPSQVIFSPDDGATWSAPRPLPPALCGDRHVVRRAPDGRIVAVFRAMPLADDAANAPTKGDFVAWVGRYADLHGGPGLDRTLRVRLLDNHDGTDCGYAGLELLADGTFVATTYGHWVPGEAPFIVSTRFTLAELDALAAAPPAVVPHAPDPALTPAAALALLEAYRPAKVRPSEPAIVAAERALLAAMAQLLRDGGPVTQRLGTLHRERAAELVPTAQHKITARDPLARVLVRFDDERARLLPVELVRAHPAAAAFPGALPTGALPEQRGLSLDLQVPGRRSLGLYAAPGSIVTLRFGDPQRPPPKGLRVRIGAHSDDISRRDAWPRMPHVSRVFAVDRAVVRTASAFGGLIYVENDDARDATIDLIVDDAYAAPLFVLGTTTADEWRANSRSAPGPWAELATGKVVLTVPSTAIRALDDPTPLLEFWDRVLDGAADLAACSRERARPERYVADVEISAGAMHSGYPIMTHLGAAADMVDLERMHRGPWGLFHELGHNHQNRDWTFAGTGEVTCNLFALYLCQILCDVPWDRAWGGNLARARERLAECVGAGRRPWGSDTDGKPDLALRLLMYSQIEREIGWEPFMHTFAEYRDLPASERPKTEQQKRDQWLERLSRAMDRDLGPFFAAWGLDVSDAARAAVAGRPIWMPEDWPAK